MSTRTVLAVDGGQSGIRLRNSLSDDTVEVPGVSHQEGDSLGQLAEAVASGFRRGAFESADLAVLGLTTAPADVAERAALCGSIAHALHVPEIWLMDDTVTSHVGALSGGWGVALVAGTGVACLAVPKDFRRAFTVDGHGFLLGDDGSAFWIGRQGIRAVLRAEDGRGSTTVLGDLARARYGGLDDLHVRLHRRQRPVNDIAQFARDVLAAADADDPAAVTIIDEAARELAATVGVAAGHISADSSSDAIPVALGGRLLKPGSRIRTRLDDALIGVRAVEARTADSDGLEGALRLGASGIPPAFRSLVHVWKEDEQ